MSLIRPAVMLVLNTVMPNNARTIQSGSYNRAYKDHYARYMKKKMTVSEFEEWSRFASDIQDKALTGEISFEQYSDIRKKK